MVVRTVWLSMLPMTASIIGFGWFFITVLHSQGGSWPWKRLLGPYLLAVLPASVVFALITWGTTVPEGWRWPFWLGFTALFAVATPISAYVLWMALPGRADLRRGEDQ